MKKAKIFLSAIVVFAVVGGALAFKAQKFSAFKVFTLNAAGTACPSVGQYDANGITSVTFTNAYTSASGTTVATSLCTENLTVYSE